MAVVGDQCMYGLTAWGKRGGKRCAAETATKFMTNSTAIAQELRLRCDGSHVHQPLISGRANAEVRYPEELCRAICRGVVRSRKEKVMQIKSLGLIDSSKVKKMPNPEDYHEAGEAAVPRGEVDSKWWMDAGLG